MKRPLISLILVLLVGMNMAYAEDNYDFAAVCSTGQTLYYKITDDDAHTVELTHPHFVDDDSGDFWEGYSMPSGDIVLPSEVEHDGILYTVTSIGDYAFYECNGLTGSLTIPNSVTSIGEGAFAYCSGLSGSLTLGNSLAVLNMACFAGTDFSSISVDSNNPFYYSEGNALISRSDKILVLGCKNTSIPNDVNAIGDYAFFFCSSLTGSLTIPSSVTSIGEGAFGLCSGLSGSLTIPSSVTSIGNMAFVQCTGFTGSLTIPNSVTSIGNSAFENCSGFTGSLTIGSSVTSIGDRAFCWCGNLESINVKLLTPLPIEEDVFCGIDKSIPVYVPFGTIDAYTSAEGWREFTNFNDQAVFYSIAVSASPIEGGGVLGCYDDQFFVGSLGVDTESLMGSLEVTYGTSGSAEVMGGSRIVLIARANTGWDFVGWKENDEIVSYESVFSFIITDDRNIEAVFEQCTNCLEPELLSGRFSVSGCTAISFARSNTFMSVDPLTLYGAIEGVTEFDEEMSEQMMAQFLQTGLTLPMEAGLLFGGIELPGINYVIGEHQWDRMAYDASTLNGNNSAYNELLLTGVDVFPSFILRGNIDCWHIPTWREWDYLINQRVTESGIRFAYGTVNEVCGLILLPDDWQVSTFALTHANEIGNYDNNVITASTWTEVLEPAGAVFLPANGFMTQGTLTQSLPDGQPVGAYPGLLISPNEELAGIPMTGSSSLYVDELIMLGYIQDLSNGGTSLRLAKVTDTSTATITLASNDSEQGSVAGAGEFACQQNCTITAVANEGYVFMYWLENGEAVSNDPTYSFQLLCDRNFTAVFAPEVDVCQLNLEVTSMNSAEMLLFGMEVSVTIDDKTFILPSGSVPDYLDLLSLAQMMTMTGNEEVVTYTINVPRESNVTIDLFIPDFVNNLMSAAGGSIGNLATYSVSYVDGGFVVENSSEFPFEFTSNCYNMVSAVPNNTEYGTINGETSFEREFYYGESCTLTASANEGYAFVSWTEDGETVSMESEYTFTVTNNRNLIANFIPTHTISCIVNPYESGFVSNNNTCFNFENGIIPDGWNNDVSAYPWTIWNSNPHEGGYCLASNNYHTSISESFVEFTVEYATNGSIDFFSRISSESVSYDYGIFYIDGVEQYREGGTGNTWTNRHFEVTAGPHVFRWYYRKDGSVNAGEDRYFIDDITLQGVGHGDVFTLGETCTLTATPATGYHFVNWTENGEVVSTESNYSFVVAGDRDLVANFALNYYDIVAVADPEEGGVVTGGGNYGHGSECTLTAIPNEGYWFLNWTENGEVLSSESTYSFSVTNDKNIVANFLDLSILPTTISDDFNDGIINTNLWTATGPNVYEEDGLLKLEQNVTDNYVALESYPMAVPSDNLITMDRKFYLHENLFNSTYGNHFFYGDVNFKINGNDDNYIGICYYDDDYENRYGTYIRTQINGEINETRICDAVFDTWLTEQVVFDLSENTLSYYRNGEFVATIDIPDFQIGYYTIAFNPYGWWTGHYHNIDYVNVNNIDIHQSFTINLTANPNNGGNVSFANSETGTYYCGQTCTITATPNDGFAFVNWTDNGTQVSANTNYSFVVDGNRNLVANFERVFMPMQGLIAYYPFNGNAYDESGHGNHGTLQGNVPQLTTDRFGNENSAYLFGGFYNSGFIYVPNSSSLQLNNAMSISFWMNLNGYDGMDGWGRYSDNANFAIICKEGDRNGLNATVNQNEDGRLNINSFNSNGSYDINACHDYMPGQWLHCVLTIEDNVSKLYVNGMLQRETVMGQVNFSNANNCNMYIGIMKAGSYWYPFNGKLDDIAIYNRALSVQEVRQLHKLKEDLIAYYPFDGDANDYSGNDFHATPCNSYQYGSGITEECISVVGQGFMESSGGHVLLPQYDFSTYSGATLSLWVNATGLTSSDGEMYINLGNHTNLDGMFILQSPDEILFQYHETNISIPYSDNYTGNWVMYTMTCGSDGKLKAYVNGTSVGEVDIEYDGQINTSLAALGRHWWYDGSTTSTRFTGSFDEVRIYGRVLSPAEVQMLYLNDYLLDITASANPTNSGTVSGTGMYTQGQTCTLTATPATGYHFVNWTENSEEITTESNYSFVVTGDRDLMANFALNYYDIMVVANPEEGGNVTGGGNYGHGTQCTLTAMPNEGYVFSSWTENGQTVSTDAVYDFTVTDGRSLVAVFLPTYVIFAEVNDENYGTVSGTGTYAYGTMVTLSATPADGYAFVNWTENGEIVSLESEYTFTVTNNRNLIANFIPTHTISCIVNPYESGFVSNNNTPVIVCFNFENGIIPDGWNNNVSAYPWTIWHSNSHAGGYCMASNNYNMHNSESFIEFAVAYVNNGSIDFFSRISSESVSYDYGIFYIDGVEQYREGGTGNTWTNRHFEVTAGTHVFRWYYRKDGSVHSGEDRYFIDDITLQGVGHGDVFTLGETCTLTATPATGYHFVNWTENGEVVSTESNYSFVVTGDRDLVANFALNYYDIMVVADLEEGGNVTGGGNYGHGSECTLTATANENYTFLYWTENGNYVSSDAAISFVATSDRTLVAYFAQNEQNISLNSGWTWLSSFIELSDINGLGMLEESINPNGVMIKSHHDGFLVYDANMWIGTLNDINNEQMYQVNVATPSEVSFYGTVANPYSHGITLYTNWNYIGYPSPFAMDVNDALANLNASEGDMLKSQSSFATYSIGDGWFGSLNQLTPGMGLMYQSLNSQPISLNYAAGMSRSMKSNLTAENNHWVPDIHAYSNNMSIMAVVELNGEEVRDGRYELAIFDGSECRGSARLLHVDSMHRYVAFLTVAGDKDSELCLALYDSATGKAYFNTDDCLNFEPDAVLGSINYPYVARFGETTDLDETVFSNIILYPNPVTAGHLFQIELPEKSTDVEISIVNALGAVVSTTTVHDKPATLKAPSVPGVYTVRITSDIQGIYCRKLIVK